MVGSPTSMNVIYVNMIRPNSNISKSLLLMWMHDFAIGLVLFAVHPFLCIHSTYVLNMTIAWHEEVGQMPFFWILVFPFVKSLKLWFEFYYFVEISSRNILALTWRRKTKQKDPNKGGGPGDWVSRRERNEIDILKNNNVINLIFYYIIFILFFT